MKTYTACLLLVCLLAVPASAQNLTVEKALIATDIQNRVPQGIGTVFSADIGKLYCFNRITLDQPPPTEVTHIWYRENQEVSKVTLPVKSFHWRTYSLKRILPSEVGSWHVDIMGPEGSVLSTVPFTITP